ncbi:MAG: TIGR03936 family radical SAM-associated protein [Nocardioidaceae bacterium]
MSKQPPQQQPPPVQRLRIQYAKRGRLRFTSHRDFSRAFERALFRARLPMAYSSGFNPHPRISYAGAAPTGTASEAEYLEIALAQVCDPELVASQIDEALPDGLDIVRVVEAGPGPLADRLQVSSWQVSVDGLDPSLAEQAVAHFVETEAFEVERMTKKGPRRFDVRRAVMEIACLSDQHLIEILLRHTTPSVRAGDVLDAIAKIAGLSFTNSIQTRVWQGALSDSGERLDPLVQS